MVETERICVQIEYSVIAHCNLIQFHCLIVLRFSITEQKPKISVCQVCRVNSNCHHLRIDNKIAFTW